ncbi:MAG: hypothetical protein AVDCRST_MAG16-2106 [uncultured Frankineae bacterium]|uniref:Uncharacterized protein n=1 Tax=uncultured Frankineae bacterium TaxID=437475 RepID=A0A6J4M0N2_9ACTN|nr:MAG: hypothetical protein AVDCRST_MAG16-2106 [uncultured Frankineae bacterium]
MPPAAGRLRPRRRARPARRASTRGVDRLPPLALTAAGAPRGTMTSAHEDSQP